MGRLIDADKLKNIFLKSRSKIFDYRVVIQEIDYAPTVEAIPKDQYEARLKADLKAILVELQLKIEELRLDRPLMSRGHECYGFEDKTPTEIRQECSDIIQQKINMLKGEEDGNE